MPFVIEGDTYNVFSVVRVDYKTRYHNMNLKYHSDLMNMYVTNCKGN